MNGAQRNTFTVYIDKRKAKPDLILIAMICFYVEN